MHPIQAHYSDQLLSQKASTENSYAFYAARWIHQTSAKGFIYKIAVVALLFFAAIALTLSLIGIPFMVKVYQELQYLKSEETSSIDDLSEEEIRSGVSNKEIPFEEIREQKNESQPVGVNYDLNRMIEEIETLAKEKIPITLWIGLPPEQPLPEDKENIWISMDMAPLSQSLDPKRIHLVCDDNFYPYFARLERIFNVVIVSPGKFLPFAQNTKDPIKTLFSLLKPDSKSYLVYNPEAIYYSKMSGVGVTFSDDGTSFMGPKSVFRTCLVKMVEKQEAYLKKHFMNVTYKGFTRFPFPDEARLPATLCDFFIANNPKRIVR